MRALPSLAAFTLAVSLLWGQAANDPAYAPLSRAYTALQARDYDSAIAAFVEARAAAPQRASIRKDLGYTYLKTGENILARDEFQAAMAIDPADTQVAMEYAFLAYETNQRQQARRIFDRVRKSGQVPYAATAEQAFENVDAPLAAGIERWTKAIEMGAGDFSVHYELAKLAEDRDDFELAAKHYEAAWRLGIDRRYVLIDLARVWQALGRGEDAQAALLAASRGGGPRAAETARELLPARYPYVSEFRRALDLDPSNAELRRDLGFLLLELDREAEAEPEFEYLVKTVPDDLLSATQLGFLRYARAESVGAQALFERVLGGGDLELANRVRAVLHQPQIAAPGAAATAAPDAREMAERSIKAGYMKDAVKYLLMAHEAAPSDSAVMLRLGWAYNLLHQDSEAIQWFAQARGSEDPRIATEAGAAWRNLRSGAVPFHVTAWVFPMYSSRWSDNFGYGQIKAELTSRLPVRAYVSARFVGDTRGAIGTLSPMYLSESAIIPAIGLRTVTWRHTMAWAEAGVSIGYLTHHALQDYRAGVSFARGTGPMLNAETAGWFAESSLDMVFVSRFGNDTLAYAQGRSGYTVGPKALRAQLYWNCNLTADVKRQAWANFIETGPGMKLSAAVLPKAAFLTVNALHGRYTTGGPVAFNDLRVGLWYAFTR